MKTIFSDNTLDIDRYLVRATPAQKLERWLGAEEVESISKRMKGWYGPPVPIAGVPGRVYACGDGDFCGPIKGGYYGNLVDYIAGRVRKATRLRHGSLNAGFTSLSDMISEATVNSKKQTWMYQKVGVAAPAIGSSQWLWRQGTLPATASVAAAAPGGTNYTRTTTGALEQFNATAGDTLHFVNWIGTNTLAGGTSLMLVDVLWGANFNMATSGNVAVTGAPTRYQTATTAPGNFISGNVTTVLNATANNLTLTYVDQDGNAAEAGSALAIRVSSAVGTIPYTQPTWFYPLNSGDTGLRNITNHNLSAASTGNVDQMIAHPIALLPAAGVANQSVVLDGINSSFNLERIYDDAALTFIEYFKSATTATTYSGFITLLSG
jgi:hypothetical protein